MRYIYVDVLLILNLYVNYFLLRATGGKHGKGAVIRVIGHPAGHFYRPDIIALAVVCAAF